MLRSLIWLFLASVAVGQDKLTLLDGREITAPDRLAQLRAVGFWIDWPDGTRTASTLGEYIDKGGDIKSLNLKKVTPADLEFVLQSSKRVEHPAAKPIPARSVPVPTFPALTPTTGATSAASRSTPSNGFHRMGSTYIIVPAAAIRGGTDKGGTSYG